MKYTLMSALAAISTVRAQWHHSTYDAPHHADQHHGYPHHAEQHHGYGHYPEDIHYAHEAEAYHLAHGQHDYHHPTDWAHDIIGKITGDDPHDQYHPRHHFDNESNEPSYYHNIDEYDYASRHAAETGDDRVIPSGYTHTDDWYAHGQFFGHDSLHGDHYVARQLNGIANGDDFDGYEVKKYADPEWAKIKGELQQKEWFEKTDPAFRMKKEQYDMYEDWAEMRYKADPKYQAAKYNAELADCDAEFSRYQDPAFVKAYNDYRYYKDYDLDKDWSGQWLAVKYAKEKAEQDAEDAKEASQPCAGYIADIKAAKDAAMTAYFNTPALQEVRKTIEDAEKKEDDLEK